MADDQNLDLVEIAPNADPPVCKVMDYRKYKYEQDRKAKAARNVGWRIDYWLASREIAGRVINPEIHPEQMGSDHCPVSIEII